MLRSSLMAVTAMIFLAGGRTDGRTDRFIFLQGAHALFAHVLARVSSYPLIYETFSIVILPSQSYSSKRPVHSNGQCEMWPINREIARGMGNLFRVESEWTGTWGVQRCGLSTMRLTYSETLTIRPTRRGSRGCPALINKPDHRPPLYKRAYLDTRLSSSSPGLQCIIRFIA